VITGTTGGVTYHDEDTKSVPWVVRAIHRCNLAALNVCAASHTSVIRVTPNRAPTKHNQPRFRGMVYRPERGDSVAKGRVSIVVERCKACGFCVEFCPTHVLALSSAFNSKGYHPPHVVHPEKCSGCDLCGMYCPDFAIFATKVAPAGGDK
jgi:2-oxoglutarate ferredoxin oxidoreductase subunit delta